MITQRFNINNDWNSRNYNYMFLGFTDMLSELSKIPIRNATMIEIGSYMGESTMLFAASGLFKKIYSIEPHDGSEEFNEITNITWGEVKDEYNLNTRNFDNISLISDYSYNVVDKFQDNSIDFIYIDANHSYESVKRDLELYLPKLKNNGIIGGHDYNPIEWSDVCKAVDEVVGKPKRIFLDTSWISNKKQII